MDVEKEGVMFTLDVKDAHRAVSIDPRDRKRPGLWCNNVLFIDNTNMFSMELFSSLFDVSKNA